MLSASSGSLNTAAERSSQEHISSMSLCAAKPSRSFLAARIFSASFSFSLFTYSGSSSPPRVFGDISSSPRSEAASSSSPPPPGRKRPDGNVE